MGGQDMIGSKPEGPRAFLFVTTSPIIGRQKAERILELFAAWEAILTRIFRVMPGTLIEAGPRWPRAVPPFTSPIHPGVESAEEVSGSPGLSSSIDAFDRFSSHVFHISKLVWFPLGKATSRAFRGNVD